jgi:hypothetical protein
LRDFKLPRLAGERAATQTMEMIMKKIMCMVALGIALIGSGQLAFAQGVRTGSPQSEQSDGGNAYGD